MRVLATAWIFLAALAGCGPANAPGSIAQAPTRARTEPDRPPIDPIAALTPDETVERSWVVPGPIQLELGGTSISTAGSGRPIEVAAIDRQGNLERVAVRLEHARFSVWTDRAHLLSVLRRDQRIDPIGPPPAGGIEVVLRSGTTVRRLAHRERATQIRYLGALQVEGWLPDTALADHGRGHDGAGRVPTGRKTLMVIPGAVIRSEPRWAASELAIVANGYFLDTIREVDEAWTEVSYEDADVAVHGFVSKRDPPGRVHRWRETDGTPAIAPNASAASGTCLYARPNGEAIGYIVGNRPVDLDDAGPPWWTITLDTPWGPLPFAARGAAKTELAACAPPGSVPPVTPPPPPPPP
jgi:hypothetical protein